MKPYVLPIIASAAVIAVATLGYTIFMPAEDEAVIAAKTDGDNIIEAPKDAQQAVITNATDPVKSDEPAAQSLSELVIDVARVQPDGMAVFAGKGAAGGQIFITENGAILAQNAINEQGEWVVLPEEPLSPGAHLLELQMVTKEGLTVRADVSLVVEIAQSKDEKPLVAVVPQTDEAAPQLLQKPEDDADVTATDTIIAANSAGSDAAKLADDSPVITENKPENKPENEPENNTETASASASSTQTELASQSDDQAAETVAEILGQAEIFIQIGSLSWGADGTLFLHGVASGGDIVSGMIDGTDLADYQLGSTGRWSLSADGDLFDDGISKRAQIQLLNDTGKTLAETSLSINKAQLQAGLDGSLMVVVHKGDALWRIAYRSYGKGVRYVDIFKRNADKITDPDLIYPDQIFAVPGVSNN